MKSENLEWLLAKVCFAFLIVVLFSLVIALCTIGFCTLKSLDLGQSDGSVVITEIITPVSVETHPHQLTKIYVANVVTYTLADGSQLSFIEHALIFPLNQQVEVTYYKTNSGYYRVVEFKSEMSKDE